ncbi:S-adenosyl-L-methionine-dependent methyltransferase [Trichophaea hybrida]|nr:S-adenosyl-L-methionine-dependent methyltransferase [Trichophaea hybrida]
MSNTPPANDGGSAIEVDPAILENTDDDDYGSVGVATTTDSLSLSINQYIFENGRRYHTYFGIDKNFMPTDEKEQERLDMHHETMLQMAEGKLYLAPLKDPQNILDIGTGTGIWAIDAADQHPEAHVIGTDLSPIQPAWVPPNCVFQVDDAEQEWTFQTDTFDFVHSRNLAQCIGDWPKLMAEIYRCTKPRGYCQLGEMGPKSYSDDNTLNPGIQRHFDLCNEAMAKLNRPSPVGATLKKYLEDAGFVDVVCVDLKQPLGPWPKDKRMKRIGAMTMLMCETGLEAYGMAALTRILQMSHEEATKVFADALRDVRNKNCHVYSLL